MVRTSAPSRSVQRRWEPVVRLLPVPPAPIFSTGFPCKQELNGLREASPSLPPSFWASDKTGFVDMAVSTPSKMKDRGAGRPSRLPVITGVFGHDL
jgi:hypothetical protein